MNRTQHSNWAVLRAPTSPIARAVTAGPSAWGRWLASTSILEGFGFLFVVILVLSAITAPLPLEQTVRGAVVVAVSFATFMILLVIGLRVGDEQT